MKRILMVGLLAALLVACGGAGADDSEMVSQGETLYGQTCFTCHGPDATGVEGLGKDLTNNEFIMGSTDQELLEYVKQGRPADHPDNTTGVAMPPKGGFDFLTDDDILAIIAYLRTLQG